LRGARGIAGRGRGVDFNELLVDIVGELLLRFQPFGPGAPDGNNDQRERPE
jgi:hypothetical protein